MIDKEISNDIKSIDSREKMISYFDGYSYERMEELDERKTKRPLIKSYILEHTGDNGKQKKIKDILKEFRINIYEIENNLYNVLDKEKNKYLGFIEALSPRYFVFYTPHKSDYASKWINNLIFNSPELDHVWLSGTNFNVLWERIVEMNKPYRYVSLLFLHDSIFEIDKYMDDDDYEKEEDVTSLEGENYKEIRERKASRIKIVDKISVLQKNLLKLQKDFPNIFSPIIRLRFPSPVGRGGHDFYDNGKVTNRSANFADHRSHILYVQQIYNEIIKILENKAWYSIAKESFKISATQQIFSGSPVTIKFNNELDDETYNNWIKSTFERINNKFRLWGNPIKLGRNKVHVYGIDKHLWKPIFLEITNKHLLAIIPQGTCGNTIQRLICNIQRYIDPSAKTYIGDIDYKNIVEEASKKINYG